MAFRRQVHDLVGPEAGGSPYGRRWHRSLSDRIAVALTTGQSMAMYLTSKDNEGEGRCEWGLIS
jgi:hypothetical protein